MKAAAAEAVGGGDSQNGDDRCQFKLHGGGNRYYYQCKETDNNGVLYRLTLRNASEV